MIYFIRAGEDGPVKIGVSNNANKRMAVLQAGMPHKLSIIRLIEGGLDEERKLHKAFSHLRIQYEWFKFDDRMLDIDPADISPIVPKPISSSRRRSTQNELVACLNAIGWSVRELTQRLECDPHLAHRWIHGTAKIPPSIATWLKVLALEFIANQPPTDWRVKEYR